MFRGKSILITGGTGSFGQAFVRKLLTEGEAERVIVFSRDEWKQSEMQRIDPLFRKSAVRYFLGDVRDPERLMRAFSEVDIVIHAAALKQVPAAEYNPTEFIQTNVNGATNVINAAIERGVEKVIALSTDKAVNPVNLYGATKLCSDKLFIAANSYVGKKQKPRFSVVRYGNVLGSRGSILPFWQSLLKKGETSLPVTDLSMTRFWIPVSQAVDFVIQAAEESIGEEIYVPKVASMKIVDMAKALSPEAKLEIIGIREGEKVHETLISAEEGRFCLEYDNHYLILPPVHHRTFEERVKRRPKKGTPVPEGFSYNSETNSAWLTADALLSLD